MAVASRLFAEFFQCRLGFGEALSGGLAEPGHCLLLVLFCAFAVVVRGTEVELRLGIALLGGRPEFAQRRRVILSAARGETCIKIGEARGRDQGTE